MSNVERRLELAFAFIEDMLAEPSRLEKLPKYAAFGVSVADDPDLTAESVEMLQKANLPNEIPRGVLIRERGPDSGDTSGGTWPLKYQSVEA